MENGRNQPSIDQLTWSNQTKMEDHSAIPWRLLERLTANNHSDQQKVTHAYGKQILILVCIDAY